MAQALCQQVRVALLSILIVLPACILPDKAYQPDAGTRRRSLTDAAVVPVDGGIERERMPPTKPSTSDRDADSGGDKTPATTPEDAGPELLPVSCGRALGKKCMFAPPQPLAPVSTGFVTTPRPTFRWNVQPQTQGARVELCLDRACTRMFDEVDAQGSSFRPEQPLPGGVMYFRLRSLTASAVVSDFSATWQFHVPMSSRAENDTSYGHKLDVNGDGFDDLVVGAPDATAVVRGPGDAGLGPGRAYVYLGERDARERWREEAPSPVLTLENPAFTVNDEFGAVTEGVGDLNGDGLSDFAIAGPCPELTDSCSEGQLYFYAGGIKPPEEPRSIYVAEAPEARFQRAMAAGDFDGDGFSDVAVARQVGVVIYRGGPAVFDQPASAPAWTITGLDSAAALCAGDVNGDGFADLVIGGRGADGPGLYFVPGGQTHGFAQGKQPMAARATPPPSAAGVRFGEAVACDLDYDGDGFNDVLVGAVNDHMQGTVQDTVFVYRGGAEPNWNVSLNINSPPGENQYFGQALAAVGDIEGDGLGDFVIGAPLTSLASVGSQTLSAGQAWLFLGADPRLERAVPFAEGGKASRFGSVIEPACDLNGDGFGDLVIGTPLELGSLLIGVTPGYYRGKLDVFFGAKSGVRPMPDATLHGPDGDGGRVGF